MYQFLPLQGPHPQPLSMGEGSHNDLIYSWSEKCSDHSSRGKGRKTPLWLPLSLTPEHGSAKGADAVQGLGGEVPCPNVP